jgi:hypothetical protein
LKNAQVVPELLARERDDIEVGCGCINAMEDFERSSTYQHGSHLIRSAIADVVGCADKRSASGSSCIEAAAALSRHLVDGAIHRLQLFSTVMPREHLHDGFLFLESDVVRVGAVGGALLYTCVSCAARVLTRASVCWRLDVYLFLLLLNPLQV